METIPGFYDWKKHSLTQKERAAARNAKAIEALEAAAPPVVLSEKEINELIEVYNEVEITLHSLRRVIFKALSARKGYRMLYIGQGDTFDGTEAAINYFEVNDKPQTIRAASLGKEE